MGWLQRHRLLTAVLAVLLLVGAVRAASDREPARTAGASGVAPSKPAPHARQRADKPHPKPSRIPEPAASPRPAKTYLVARIVDGDTLELGNGEIVRLVGIDTP